MPLLTNQASRFLGGSRAPAAPVPVAGAELLENGNFSAASDWGLDAFWTIDSGTLNVAATGAAYATQGVIGGIRSPPAVRCRRADLLAKKIARPRKNSASMSTARGNASDRAGEEALGGAALGRAADFGGLVDKRQQQGDGSERRPTVCGD